MKRYAERGIRRKSTKKHQRKTHADGNSTTRKQHFRKITQNFTQRMKKIFVPSKLEKTNGEKIFKKKTPNRDGKAKMYLTGSAKNCQF